MASNIDVTKPVEGDATTQSVRDNFAAAKAEIEALQAALAAGVSLAPILASISALPSATTGGLEKTGTNTVGIFALTSFSKSLFAGSSASAWRTALGLGTAATAAASAFANASHTHAAADLPAMVGDSGSGGSAGLVPAPAAGDAAAYRFLNANGSWQGIRGTVTGDLDFGGNKAITPELDSYSETSTDRGTLSNASETISYDDGSVQEITLGANVAFSFSGFPASGKAASVVVIFHQDATGGRAPTFPGVQWAGGTTPTLASGANAVSVLTFLTRDGGTTIYGFNGGLDFS